MYLDNLKNITKDLHKKSKEDEIGLNLSLFFSNMFDSDFSTDNIMLDSGIAISPNAAKNCVLEHLRLVRFVKAVHNSVNKLLSKKDNINIVYVGCGTYAPLLNSVLHFFNKEQLNATVLDVNKESLRYAKDTYNKIYNNTYNVEFIEDDGSKYKHSNKVDLLISECMYAGLILEPQYFIYDNFKCQMSDIGIMIPKKVSLYIDDELITSLSIKEDLKKEITLNNKNKDVVLKTIVNVDDKNTLKYKDTTITKDIHLITKETLKGAKKVIYRYVLNPFPKWSFKIIK